MHYFHANQWGIDVILGGGKWYKRKDIEEVHAKKYVFIEEKWQKNKNKISHNKRHKVPTKFNIRFTIIKVTIEMCIHIGSTNVYHIVEKKNLLQEIAFPFAIFFFVCDISFVTYA